MHPAKRSSAASVARTLSAQKLASAITALPGVAAMYGSNPYPFSPHGHASAPEAITSIGCRYRQMNRACG